MEDGKIKDEDIFLLQRMLCAIIRSQVMLCELAPIPKSVRVQESKEITIKSLGGLLQEAGELGWDFRAQAPEVKNEY